MKKAINHVKHTLSSQKDLNHFIIREGFMSANDGISFSGHPVEYDINLALPAIETQNLISRLPSEIEIKLDKNKLKIKSGRYRGELPTLDLECFSDIKPSKKYSLELTDNLIYKLISIREFTTFNSRRWTDNVIIKNGLVFATSGTSVAYFREESLKAYTLCIPVKALEVLSKIKDTPKEMCWDENSISFIWDSGAWYRTQLPALDLSEDVFRKMATYVATSETKYQTVEYFPMTEEWKKEVNNVLKFCENALIFREGNIETSVQPDIMSGTTKLSSMDLSIDTPKISGDKCVFLKSNLERLLKHGDEVDMSECPNAPLYFSGELFKGFISCQIQ